MSTERLCIAVVMQQTELANRWVRERWEPVAAELCAPGASEIEVLAASPAGKRWRFAPFDIELHRSEAEGYFLNLSAPDPKIFVMWRMLEADAIAEGGPAAAPFLATVSYNEAARMLDGGEQVDALPLLPAIRAWMEPFVQEHYKPEPKRKVRRRDPLATDPAPTAIKSTAGRE